MGIAFTIGASKINYSCTSFSYGGCYFTFPFNVTDGIEDFYDFSIFII
jgi:hypothetical protein